MSDTVTVLDRIAFIDTESPYLPGCAILMEKYKQLSEDKLAIVDEEIRKVEQQCAKRVISIITIAYEKYIKICRSNVRNIKLAKHLIDQCDNVYSSTRKMKVDIGRYKNILTAYNHDKDTEDAVDIDPYMHDRHCTTSYKDYIVDKLKTILDEQPDSDTDHIDYSYGSDPETDAEQMQITVDRLIDNDVDEMNWIGETTLWTPFDKKDKKYKKMFVNKVYYGTNIPIICNPNKIHILVDRYANSISKRFYDKFDTVVGDIQNPHSLDDYHLYNSSLSDNLIRDVYNVYVDCATTIAKLINDAIRKIDNNAVIII
jgi:hypothetical protein